MLATQDVSTEIAIALLAYFIPSFRRSATNLLSIGKQLKEPCRPARTALLLWKVANERIIGTNETLVIFMEELIR